MAASDNVDCYVLSVLEMDIRESIEYCKQHNIPKPPKDRNYETFITELYAISTRLAGNFAIGFFAPLLIRTEKMLIAVHNIPSIKQVMINYRGLIQFEMVVGSETWDNISLSS